MMQLTEEQRKALIEWIEAELLCSEDIGYTGNARKCMEIALAALTAEPGEWITYYPDTDEESQREHSRSNESCARRIAGEIGGYVEPVYYGTPPAPALRLPDTQQIYSLYCTPTTGSMNALAHIEGELLRLNATAPQPAPDGWTHNLNADAALVMLDRIDTLDPADDGRIEDIKRIIRKMAAAPKPSTD